MLFGVGSLSRIGGPSIGELCLIFNGEFLSADDKLAC